MHEYLTKGKQVYVEGRLKTRTYQAQNGETRFSIDVTCQEIQFLGGGQDQGEAAGAAAGAASAALAAELLTFPLWQ